MGDREEWIVKRYKITSFGEGNCCFWARGKDKACLVFIALCEIV
jgi:hypothetical protein